MVLQDRIRQLRPILAYHLAMTLLLWGMWRTIGLSVNDLVRFDAVHYQWIAANGYDGFRQAFFPLLPMLWRWLALDVSGVLVMNGTLYLTSLCTLAVALRSDERSQLLWCAMPSAIFHFLPYTEALFFAGATALIIGYHRGSLSVACMGLLVCTLSRPAFTVLIPSVLLTELLSMDPVRTKVLRSLALMVSMILGLGMVLVLQWRDTAEWFGFYAAQAGWGNEFTWPILPLTSWGGGLTVRLDATALFVGLLSFGALLVHIRRRLKPQGHSVPPEVLLSLADLTGISLLVLFLHGGSLFSLNRFVLATPFMLVVIDHFVRRSDHFRSSYALWSIFGILVFFLLFNSYVHIQNFLKFLVVALLLVAIPLAVSSSKERLHWSLIFLITMAAILQLFLFLRFTSGQWVA